MLGSVCAGSQRSPLTGLMVHEKQVSRVRERKRCCQRERESERASEQVLCQENSVPQDGRTEGAAVDVVLCF